MLAPPRGVGEDERVHYIDSGSGAPLVLLHAFPLDARMWNDVRAMVDDHVRLITPDQRGLGESSIGEAPKPDMDVLAADVLELLDSLALPKVFLGGCSMGGYVAMATVRKAPERISGLVLTSTKAVADTPDQQDSRRTEAERAMNAGTAGWLAENTLPNVLGTTTREQRPEVVVAARDAINRQPATGVAFAQRAMAARPDSTETMRSFTGPALVIGGAEDPMMPPVTVAELAGAVPGAEQVTLSKVGHLAPLEDPQAYADTLVRWISP